MGRATTETDARVELERLADVWRVELPGDQAARLLRFADLLMTWNARINLTGARTASGLVAEHFPDAFALASVLGGPADVVDVGSGGGLPAIPLALLRPTLRLTLVEPLAKKAAFLKTAVRDLGLAGRAQVLVARVDDLAPASYDVAVSRATFAPPVWVAVARRLVRASGRIFVLTVPDSGVAGRRLSYCDGRRELVQVAGDCST